MIQQGKKGSFRKIIFNRTFSFLSLAPFLHPARPAFRLSFTLRDEFGSRTWKEEEEGRL